MSGGIFQDKPMLEVDRTGGANDGNVYVCWSRFTGGRPEQGVLQPIDGPRQHLQPADRDLSFAGDQVGPGLRHRHRGRRRRLCHVPQLHANQNQVAGLGFARSTDGGASFSRAWLITTATVYNPFDIDRNCGDGPVHCPSDLVFHRVPLEPRVTSDQTGTLPGVWLTYNAVKPDTIVPSDPVKAMSYFSAGAGQVGQSPCLCHPHNQRRGDMEHAGHGRGQLRRATSSSRTSTRHAGELGVVWQDNRGPTYDVQYPIGNTRDAQGRAISAERRS